MKGLVARAGVFIRDTVSEFLAESPFQLAAALSFYTLLSLSPLVLVVVAGAGLVWGQDAVRKQVVTQIEEVVGPYGADTVELVLRHAEDPRGGRISVIVGVLTLLLGATTVFAQLQTSLNRIWNVKAVPDRHVLWGLIRTRLLSLALVLTVGFVLLVSLVLSAALAALHDYLAHLMPWGGTFWKQVNRVVSLGVITVLIAAIYRVLPDVHIPWRYVWAGAAFTSVLFALGKVLIGVYLGHASIGSSYGAAGSLVVFLVWVYYSALILFLGAEITQVYARQRGARFVPLAHARVAEGGGR
ncbi:MAG TPA: YihY/virulence factor BrkB family protein [Methylomirabilota bacterium]|nr:YihY/virulence factor BrkB family protein [Methylomirabilota bacterium]